LQQNPTFFGLIFAMFTGRLDEQAEYEK